MKMLSVVKRLMKNSLTGWSNYVAKMQSLDVKVPQIPGHMGKELICEMPCCHSADRNRGEEADACSS